MDNYEKLKETKIIYEYLNDLLTNGNFEIPEDYEKSLKITMSAMADMYSNIHSLMYKYSEEYEQLKTNLACPCCDKDVIISDLITYAYVCDRCDENYYLCEGDLNHEWYFEDKNDEKLEDDFDLELSYDAEEKNVIIGTESSSGAEYECRNIADLKKAIESYAYNYINYENEETYSIKIWETEELRDMGEAFNYLKTYYSKEDAIDDAIKIMDRFGYAYLEVLKDNDDSLVFGTDGVEHTYYNESKYQNKIYKVTHDELTKYVNDWTNKNLNENHYDLLYCEDNGKFVAVDNRSGDCFVEEFQTEAQAVFWLDGDITVDEIPFFIIPKDIVEKVIDTTKNNNKITDFENNEGGVTNEI